MSKVIFKSSHFLCHFTGASFPAPRSVYIVNAVSLRFQVRQSFIVLLSVFQFNEVLWFRPNNEVLVEKSRVSRKEGRREGAWGKGVNSSVLGLPFKMLRRFFFLHSNNLLTLSYATSDCNYFTLLGWPILETWTMYFVAIRSALKHRNEG